MKLSELKDIDVQELVEKLQGLDMENVGSWPTFAKVLAAIVVFVVALVAGYFLSITELNDQLEQARNKEVTLMQELERKAFRAYHLEDYRTQLADMEETFGSLLQQLPQETEVPGLLEDISHTGIGSGLEFDKIELDKEIEKEFYAELPIKMSIKGEYHGMGSFVSGVAALPRIVTLHDFHIKPLSSKGDGDTDMLQMDVTAKTYRYSARSASSSSQRR